jgi:beta-hydroxylase
MEQQNQDKVSSYLANRILEKVFRRFSVFGDSEFFNNQDFHIAKVLEENYEIIKKEFEEIDKRTNDFAVFHKVSDDQLYISNDDKWRLFFLKSVNVRFENNCDQMPETMKLIDADKNIVSAYLSVLGPNKMLMPHCGPWSGILRIHLALKVPESDGTGCTLVVNGKEYKWQEGKVVVFDDTYEHIAVNMTDEERTVLFMDFMRPLPFPLRWINRICLGTARYLPYFKGYIKRIRDWEKNFYEAVPRG